MLEMFLNIYMKNRPQLTCLTILQKILQVLFEEQIALVNVIQCFLLFAHMDQAMLVNLISDQTKNF